MRRRCKDPTNVSFQRYGNRGIKICKRWESFASFLLDMGPRPTPSHTIERQNNDGDYTPNNCFWATPSQQARNRSTNRIVQFQGHKMTLAEAVSIAGMDHSAFLARVKLGWTEEQALSIPINRHGHVNKRQIDEIKNDQRTLREIAANYGIAVTTVWRIKHGRKTKATQPCA